MEIEIRNLTVGYGRMPVLTQVCLEVRRRETLAVLGPSGCGKTTLLLAICGLLPDHATMEGRILFDQKDVTEVPASRREIPMVFQNYALFPNMTAYDNVSFPLRIRHIRASEVAERTSAALELVHLSAKRSRYPHHLSGGEQQRVALARSLVLRPSALLLDEPVGALDRHLREQLLEEIKQLQHRTGIAMVYVTHDQTEAMYLADRIAVLNEGRIQQIGQPVDVYSRPESLFVARFLGSVNILRAKLKTSNVDESVFVTASGIEIRASPGNGHLPVGQGCFLAIRPEKVRLSSSGKGFMGEVRETAFVGGETRYTVHVGDFEEVLQCRSTDGKTFPAGSSVLVSWSPIDVIPLVDN